MNAWIIIHFHATLGSQAFLKREQGFPSKNGPNSPRRHLNVALQSQLPPQSSLPVWGGGLCQDLIRITVRMTDAASLYAKQMKGQDVCLHFSSKNKPSKSPARHASQPSMHTMTRHMAIAAPRNDGPWADWVCIVHLHQVSCYAYGPDADGQRRRHVYCGVGICISIRKRLR